MPSAEKDTIASGRGHPSLPASPLPSTTPRHRQPIDHHRLHPQLGRVGSSGQGQQSEDEAVRTPEGSCPRASPRPLARAVGGREMRESSVRRCCWVRHADVASRPKVRGESRGPRWLRMPKNAREISPAPPLRATLVARRPGCRAAATRLSRRPLRLWRPKPARRQAESERGI